MSIFFVLWIHFFVIHLTWLYPITQLLLYVIRLDRSTTEIFRLRENAIIKIALHISCDIYTTVKEYYWSNTFLSSSLNKFKH